MKTISKHLVSKRIIIYEIFAFVFIILIIWFDEIIDIPYLLLGAEKTPLNWRESLFESVIISIIGIVIIYITLKLFRKMKSLEGLLPICASCKKIRDENGLWNPIEVYVRDRSEAEFSHGICPECAKKLYPGFNSYDKDE